jgi:hypothetical protein
MNKVERRADYLINRILDSEGQKDPDLEKDIEDFIEKNPGYRNKFLRATHIQEIITRDRPSKEIDVEKSYNDFIKRNSLFYNTTIQVKRIMKYAAMLVLPLLLAGGLYLSFQKWINETGQYIADGSNIEAGKAQARLKLSSGEVLSLDNKSGSLQEEDGTVIEFDSAGVSYNYSGRRVEEKYNQLDIPIGGEFFIVLSDGTRVWLNSKSSLRYPTQFRNDVRRVFLEGEAYFEVADNPLKPFDVVVDDLSVRALGTSFNIMAYEDELFIETSLIEGKVQIFSDELEENKAYKLYPSYQARYERSSKIISQERVNTDNIIAWKNGLFVFDNENIETIMQRLSRWYNIDIEFVDLLTDDYHFTGSIRRYENISKILDMLEMTTKLDFMIEGRKIILSEKK